MSLRLAFMWYRGSKPDVCDYVTCTLCMGCLPNSCCSFHCRYHEPMPSTSKEKESWLLPTILGFWNPQGTSGTMAAYYSIEEPGVKVQVEVASALRPPRAMILLSLTGQNT